MAGMSRRIALSLMAVLAAVPLWAHRARLPWVTVNGAGRLVYRTLPRGDRIADFSCAGYMGGGVPLPTVPAAVVVKPSGGDDTAAIQHAIDQVSALPVRNGFRGAVMLAPGRFECSGTLTIGASGVVLRGSGATSGGTILQMTGQPHVAFAIYGDETIQPAGPAAHIVQDYVPSGAQSITVDDPAAFAAGDTVRIVRFTTPAWLHFMGMDHLSRNGRPETWVGHDIATLRTVVARQGNVLQLDVPLTDSYDRKYLPPEGAEVRKVLISGRIEQVGVQDLHIVAPPRYVDFHSPLFRAMNIDGLRDGWVKNILVNDTTEGIDLQKNALRVTMENVFFRHKATVTSPAKPADFLLAGTQLLVYRCGSTGDDEFYVMTGARNQGPNVVLDSKFLGDGRIQPHQRWATGLLIDNTQVPQGGIDMMSRGELGSGHGWTMGWGVVWNSAAASLVIQNPPGAANWSIGTSGDEQTAPMKIVGVPRRELGPDLPQGIIESAGHRVLPESLYRAQLAQRLGARALRALE
jgi:hypothetical protein